MIDYPGLYNKLLTYYPKVSSLLPKALVPPPLHVFILTTYRCNLKCEMCVYLALHKSAGEGKQELSLSELKRLIDETAPYGLITFTGGEVMVRQDFLEMMAYASDRRKLNVITNGTMLTDDIAGALVGMGPRSIMGKGLLLVGVSVEGPEEVHDALTKVPGSYRKTMRGLETLLSHKRKAGVKYPLVNIQTVISPSTVGHLRDMYVLAREKGVDILNLAVVSMNIYTQKMGEEKSRGLDYCPELPKLDIGLLSEQLHSIEDLAREGGPQLRLSPSGLNVEEVLRHFRGEAATGDYACYAPWSKALVNPYGDMFLCILHGCGNIREEGFKGAWRSDAAHSFRKRLSNVGLFKGCSACCWLTYRG